VDSQKLSLDSYNSSAELRSLLTLGLLTGLGLELLRRSFHFDEDVTQITAYPAVMLLFLFILRKRLSRVAMAGLLFTLPMLAFSIVWTQGGFRLGGHAFISDALLKDKRIHSFTTNYNRAAELLELPKLQTIHKSFDDTTAGSWGEGRAGVLLYLDHSLSKMKVFSGGLKLEQSVNFGDFDLTVRLLPEWIPFDLKGTPIEYLAALTTGLEEVNELGDGEAIELLEFVGRSAGLSQGRWMTPVPRAAALAMSATATLITARPSDTGELQCATRHLRSSVKKLRPIDSPELQALVLNNLGVANLARFRATGTYPPQIIALVRRQFAKASAMKSITGEPVLGARLAVANLFAMDGAGLTARRQTRVNKVKNGVKLKKRNRSAGVSGNRPNAIEFAGQVKMGR